MIIININTSN